MRILQTIIFLFIATSVTVAQQSEIKEVLNFTIDKTTSKTFFKNGYPSIYLDDQGKYVIFNNHEKMLLIANDGSVKLRKGHLKPTKRFTSFALDFIKDANPENPHIQMMPEISFEEGAGYYVFDKHDIALVMEYNLLKNHIYALDLITGEKIWTKDTYRYTTEAKSQITKALAGLAVQRFLSSVAFNSNLDYSQFQFVVHGMMLNEELLISQHASPEALSWITPLEDENLFLLKTNDGLVCLDLKTGEEKWQYETPINVAYSNLIDNKLVLINYTATYLSSSEKSIVALNMETGSELWKSEYLSEFLPGRTSVVGDRLILDYYGTEIFDLNNGNRLLLSIDESAVKAHNTMMNVMGGGDNNDQMAKSVEPALIDENYVYTSTYTSLGKKYPNMGGGKVQVQKYDIKTGDLIWESEELDRNLSMVNVLSNDVVLGKVRGMNKRSFIIVDKETGKMKKETEQVASMILRQRPADLWMDEVVFRRGKKEIHAFSPTDWTITKSIEVESAGVGKMQTIGYNQKGIYAICDDGIAFYNKNAEMARKVDIEKIQSSTQHGDDLLLFTKDQMFKVDVNNPDQITDFNASPEAGDKKWIFSPDSKYILTINDEELTMLQLL